MPSGKEIPSEENKFVPRMHVENQQAEMPHIKEMQEYIEKYSSFVKHVPQPRSVTGEYVLITGVTGGIGSHVAARVAMRDDVKKVYCLVRANSPQHARQRVLDELEARRVGAVYEKFSPKVLDKLHAYPSDLGKPDLGLSRSDLEELKTNMTSVIHGAWIINFRLPLSAYGDNIASCQHLINLCLSTRSPKPAAFNFLSSLSAVAFMPMMVPADPQTGRISIPETLPPTLAATDPNLGYGQSKLVGEHLCHRASTRNPSLTTRAFRIGQVVGDAVTGIWNPRENIPRMWQTALLVGALPAQDTVVRFLPVDECAGTIVDLSLPSADDGGIVPGGTFNLTNPHVLRWTEDLMPMLHALGLRFETVAHREWLDRLRALPQETKRYPPLKLLPVWSMWEAQRSGSGLADGSPRRSIVSPSVYWQTDRTITWSKVFRTVKLPDQRLVGAQLRWLESEGWERDARGQGRGGAAAGSRSLAVTAVAAKI